MIYYKYLQQHQGCQTAKRGRYHSRNDSLWAHCFVFPIHCQPLAIYTQMYLFYYTSKHNSALLCISNLHHCHHKTFIFCTVKQFRFIKILMSFPSSPIWRITIITRTSFVIIFWKWSQASNSERFHYTLVAKGAVISLHLTNSSFFDNDDP